MLIIDPSFEILQATANTSQMVERIGRVCYKSEDKITDTSSKAFTKMLIKRGHHAMIEHACASVKFVTNRGVTHEIVRHRLPSFAQESTRYVNYSGKGCCFIRPIWCSDTLVGDWGMKDGAQLVPGGLCGADETWFWSMKTADNYYQRLIDLGWQPGEAREVLPNSTKTEIVVTANFREWRHIFNLRAIGTTGKPHPEMVRIMKPCMEKFIELWPDFFQDLTEEKPILKYTEEQAQAMIANTIAKIKKEHNE